MSGTEPSLGIETAVTSLAGSADAITALTRGLDAGMGAWRPSAEEWSIVEIVNHLADEESDDFRARLDHVLHKGSGTLPPIPSLGTVGSRRYVDSDLDESVARFRAEREKSIAWLRALESPTLGNTARHPRLGEMSGEDLLANWVAHDLLHLRQITRRRYEWLTAAVAPIDLGYAGNWR